MGSFLSSRKVEADAPPRTDDDNDVTPAVTSAPSGGFFNDAQTFAISGGSFVENHGKYVCYNCTCFCSYLSSPMSSTVNTNQLSDAFAGSDNTYGSKTDSENVTNSNNTTTNTTANNANNTTNSNNRTSTTNSRTTDYSKKIGNITGTRSLRPSSKHL